MKWNVTTCRGQYSLHCLARKVWLSTVPVCLIRLYWQSTPRSLRYLWLALCIVLWHYNDTDYGEKVGKEGTGKESSAADPSAATCSWKGTKTSSSSAGWLVGVRNGILCLFHNSPMGNLTRSGSYMSSHSWSMTIPLTEHPLPGFRWTHLAL